MIATLPDKVWAKVTTAYRERMMANSRPKHLLRGHSILLSQFAQFPQSVCHKVSRPILFHVDCVIVDKSMEPRSLSISYNVGDWNK